MKIAKIIVTLSLLACTSSTAHAQLGTPRYKIQNRNELRSLLLKNARNPQALYDLTILANRGGYLGTVLETGDEMLKKNPKDSYAQSLVAFGVSTGLYARFWDWPVDKTAGDVWGRQAEASLFRSQALNVRDPAVQLMAAISLANAPTNAGFAESLRLFQLVLENRPKWADAHYWYGRALNRASSNQGESQRKKVALQVLSHMERAEELDGGLHNFLLFDKFAIYSRLGQGRLASAAFEAYLRAYPAFKQDVEERSPGYIAKTRARLAKQIQ